MHELSHDTSSASSADTAPGASIEIEATRRPSVAIPSLEGFVPRVVDAAYLEALGVTVTPSPETIAELTRGSHLLMDRLAEGTLLPRHRVTTGVVDEDGELEIHNYTGACPTLTYEISPVVGCHVGCLYCLVTDGSHVPDMTLWTNYPRLVANVLERHRETPHFYYFSAKTEALQAPTLATGVAHDILRTLIDHFERYPDSKARLFLASKGGMAELEHRHRGDRIIDLFARLRGKMQFNTSVSIMPEPLRLLLEPHAPPLEDRLRAVHLCQSHGVQARSALVQPVVVPYLTDEIVEGFFESLAGAGIVNFKPELLTVDMANLAMIGQLLGHVDKEAERRLYEIYCDPTNADHVKQRRRTAPDRALSVATIERLVEAGRRHGLTASICYWLRQELHITPAQIPIINARGYQCLGYQTRLFDDD